MAERVLIVNADDFGQDPAFNRGTRTAYDDGVVTSASLMVRWPAAADAVALGAERPGLSLGIHLDLGEWSYADDEWTPLYRVVDADDPAAVEREVAEQLDRFSALVGRAPTHVDSHQHAHLSEPAASVISAAAASLGVPLRSRDDRVRYRGDFYGQSGRGDPYPEGITVDALVSLVMDLPPGITELGCHPGLGDDLDTMYRDERLQEVRSLCDLRVRAAIARCGVQLRSFAALSALVDDAAM